MTTATLYRAADDDMIVGTASFAETLETAREYLDNPGFGGDRLWTTTVEIDDSTLLDLSGDNNAIGTVCALLGCEHPGAIGIDEWVPMIVSSDLAALGYEWVRVRESFPADTVTWIFIGSDDPELEEIEA